MALFSLLGCQRGSVHAACRSCLLFTILLSWPDLLQLLSGVPCMHWRMAWNDVIPSQDMPLSIGPLRNRLPIVRCPSSTALSFLQPKSFWDIWDLFDSLYSCVTLSFHWVPGHAGLPGIVLAKMLAKTGANTPLYPCFQPASPGHCKDETFRYTAWRWNLSRNPHTHFCSLTYICRKKRKENSSLRTTSAEFNSSPSRLSRI